MAQSNQSRKEAKHVMPMANTFSHISPVDLEEVMEWLQDKGYLTDKGCSFKSAFWYLFIRKSK